MPVKMNKRDYILREKDPATQGSRGAETKEARAARLLWGRQMREVCTRCGAIRGVHGGPPPHTIGDECAGFQGA